MNWIFSRDRKVRRGMRVKFGVAAATSAFFTLFLSAGWVCAQRSADASAEFKRISGELSAARLGGADENAAQMETALAYLDTVVVSILTVNGPAGPDLDRGNQRL